MIYSRSGGSLGIGFAIPINSVRETLMELKKYGKIKRGYIGVQIAPMDVQVARSLGLPNNEGALVGAVINDSPAHKAGIRANDVIIEIDGKKTRNYISLIRQISKMKIGSTAKLTIWRDRGKNRVYVKIIEQP